MAVSPLIIGLLGIAGILTAGVCLVLAALCRRHYFRRHHHHLHHVQHHHHHHRRSDNGTKHLPMEAVIAADGDLVVDASGVTGLRNPAAPDAAAAVEAALRNGGGGVSNSEVTGPDIIRNQYERKSGQGFVKVYEPTEVKDEDDNDDEGEEYAFKNVAKEAHIPNQIIYRSLPRSGHHGRAPAPTSIPGAQTLTHKYRGPEVVTTSNRIQESCI